MSKTKTKHLGDKYEGVRPLWIDTEKVGKVRPTSPEKLKELYHELPDYHKGNEKIGLTDTGYAVYRNTTNDQIGYYWIVVRPSDTVCGRYWYPNQEYNPTLRPHEDYGNHWIISPE